MARVTPRPLPIRTVMLKADCATCRACGHGLRTDYLSRRVVTTLDGVVELRVQVRRCHTRTCRHFGKPVRPLQEARIALPHHEFGFDVVALVGTLRYAHHRSSPEIHAALAARGVVVAPRTVTNLLDRYDELLGLRLAGEDRLRRIGADAQGHLVVGLDGLQPDVGHEVLWVVRECRHGEILRARTMLSARNQDLAALLREVQLAVGVPISGVVSDGQHSIRNAVAIALPGVPHQLCHFHYLREAGLPIFEADRHAKKLLKAQVRGIRPLERQLEGRTDPDAVAARGYCAAVRSALTDDGRPPLAASGLKLHSRLSAIATSLARAAKKGGLPPELTRLHTLVLRGLAATRRMWPPIRRAYRWVHRVAHVLAHPGHRRSLAMRRRLGGVLGALVRALPTVGPLRDGLRHFLKVTRSYWPGLFACYDNPEIPRTNNDLEHLFGTYRYHERRATGRKVASPSMVVRGSVRIVAATATRAHPVAGDDLAPANLPAWRHLRHGLEQRREARTLGRRFRKRPLAYLHKLERILAIKSGLPS